MIEAWYEKKEQLDSQDESRKKLNEPVEAWDPNAKAVVEVTELDMMEKEIEKDYKLVMEKDEAAGKDRNFLA